MGILERIAASEAARRQRGTAVERMGIDQWITDYLIPSKFNYNGTNYPFGGLTTTMQGQKIQQIASTLPAYAAALRQSPPAFAAVMVRALVLSQMRFTWRNLPSSATPRRMFGTKDLGLLERPWPKATTSDLVSTMEWHASLTGNSIVVRQADRLRVLRPDWCGFIFGSQQDPDEIAATALDGELIGLVYRNGGLFSGQGEVHTLLADEFAHWAPIPDPECPGMGQSWITAALADIQSDHVATQHKLMFFANGATPNLVVKGIPAATREQFTDLVEMMEARHAGVANAYKTLYLTLGADASVVGSDLQQLDFKATQGAGETRIAMLGRVPAPLLGISEGLAGSSLNAGNFGMARRIFADSWIYPSMQDLAASLQAIVRPPRNPRTGVVDSELWFDIVDMPILREDAKDLAEIARMDAATLRQLADAGWKPDAAVQFVISRDPKDLLGQHTGVFSVQLQPPNTQPANTNTTTPPKANGGNA